MFEKLKSLFPRSQGRPAASANAEPVGRPYVSSDLSLLGYGGDLSVATAYRCVDVIARSVAVLPMRVQWLRGDIFADRPADRLTYLLNVQPSPDVSAVDFREALVRQLLLHGNAYVLPIYSSATQ